MCKPCRNEYMRQMPTHKRCHHSLENRARQNAKKKGWRTQEKRQRWRYRKRIARILEQIHAQGFSWAEIGRLTGISVATLASLRKQSVTRPTGKTVIKIDALLVSIEGLANPIDAHGLAVVRARMAPWRERYVGRGQRYDELRILPAVMRGRGKAIM
jgi:hypothetical protein